MGRHAAPQASSSSVVMVRTDSMPMVPVTDPNLFSAPIIVPPLTPAVPQDREIDEEAEAARAGLEPRSARSALTAEVPVVLPARLSGRSLLDRSDRPGGRRRALGLDLDVVLASGAVVLAGGVALAAIVLPRL